MSKAREFWIDTYTNRGEIEDDGYYAGDALSRHPRQGPPSFQAGLVHVREVLPREVCACSAELSSGDLDAEIEAECLKVYGHPKYEVKDTAFFKGASFAAARVGAKMAENEKAHQTRLELNADLLARISAANEKLSRLKIAADKIVAAYDDDINCCCGGVSKARDEYYSTLKELGL